jgi:D-glycero-alpha-D-manno-heptose-7-phosphate kinase
MWDILVGDGELDEVGVLLDTSWRDKQRLASGITSTMIDRFYESARSVSSRIGGKICGAGGGGFLLLYVPPEYQADVRRLLRDLPEACVGFSQAGSRVTSIPTTSPSIP